MSSNQPPESNPPPVPKRTEKIEITEEIYRTAIRRNSIRWILTIGSSLFVFVVLWEFFKQGYIGSLFFTCLASAGVYAILTKALPYADLPSTMVFKKYKENRRRARVREKMNKQGKQI